MGEAAEQPPDGARGIDAVLAAIPPGAAPIAVTGGGELAEAVRRRLGIAAGDSSGARPAVVVETTGTAAGVRAALAEVDDLGTVVLAARCAPAPLDLYADLHVRGLELVGADADAT